MPSLSLSVFVSIVFAMLVCSCALIYVLSFAYRLEMCGYTVQNCSKIIEEIIKEIKHSFSVHLLSKQLNGN